MYSIELPKVKSLDKKDELAMFLPPPPPLPFTEGWNKKNPKT